MNLSNIAIATISWARNEEEKELLQSSLQTLADINLPVFITDAGSEEGFVDFVKKLSNTTLTGTLKGVWPQARQSIQAAAASGAEWILYTEPDKLEFFKNHLIEKLQQLQFDKTIGVYLFSRDAAGFQTFPSFQQMTETTINACCAEVTGQRSDYVYGPFLFHSSLAQHLHHLPDDIGWGWRPFVFITAHRSGLRLQSVQDHFVCPPHQREEDAGERIYRMKQLAQNINGITLAANIKLDIA